MSPTPAKHRIPLGLQIIARALESTDVEGDYLRDILAKADIRAARLLSAPLLTLEAEGPGQELTAPANEFGAEGTRARIVAVIPPEVTHDPGALIAEHAGAWQQAGLYLGLCLGFRIAAGLSGNE